MGGGPDDCRPCLRRRWTLRFQQQLCRPVVSRGSLAGLFCFLTWSAGPPCVAACPEVIGGDGSDPSHEESFPLGPAGALTPGPGFLIFPFTLTNPPVGPWVGLAHGCHDPNYRTDPVWETGVSV